MPAFLLSPTAVTRPCCHLNVRDRSILLFTMRKAVTSATDRSVAPPNTWFMSDVVIPLYKIETPERVQIAATANPRFVCMLSAAPDGSEKKSAFNFSH
jgi:hypothetical protein